nr:G protein-coupled receptor [Proales similis]
MKQSNVFLVSLCLSCLHLILVTGQELKARKKLVVPGDLMIGALLPVHEQPSYSERPNGPRECGVIRDQYGVQRVEALLYMLDKINKDESFLPGVRIGLEIRDECWDSSIALEETIDFIKDTITSDTNLIGRDSSMSRLNESSSIAELTADQANKCSSLEREKQTRNRILAVIGPGGSSVAINVQNLLQLFDIPQVGYSATSKDLSDKQMYQTFLRVVPSDYLQVRAITDVVIKMNWTYIFAIYTDGSYGQAGMDSFKNEIAELNVCIASLEKIREYASDSDFDLVVRRLSGVEKAHVIVCFCYGETVRGLLGAINRLNLTGRFLIVGSDGWSDRIDVARGLYEQAVGSFSFKAYSPEVTEFDSYFTNLNPISNQRNVWFNEYWEEMFKCYIEPHRRGKFRIPCKRLCPTGLMAIGNACYWLSETSLSWQEAENKCKSVYHDAELLDAGDDHSLDLVLNYLSQRGLKEHLSRLHVKVKLNSILKKHKIRHTSDFDSIGDDAQGIRLRFCQPLEAIKDKHDPHFFAALSSSDTITYFISRTETDINNITLLMTSDERFGPYCIDLNGAQDRQPFICRFQTPLASRSDQPVEFYPDSLRNYQQDPKMSYVMNSMLAIAHGLNNAHRRLCSGHYGLCESMKNINGSMLLGFIKTSMFEGVTGEKIYFDTNGDPPGRYVVLNVQKDRNQVNASSSYVYRQVGNWNNFDKLNLNDADIVFPNNQSNYESVCSEPCPFGSIKQVRKGNEKCCWNCKKCASHAFIVDEYTCQDCNLGYWPNENLTGCGPLPLTFLNWTEPVSLFAMCVSILGIMMNTFVLIVFIRFANTCVVKSTTRELSLIVLIGVYMSYILTFPLLMRPSIVTCYMARILPGLSLSLMYSALVVKTNRIARILARSKKRILIKKPRFMSLGAQIFLTFCLIAFELAIIVGSFFHKPGGTVVTHPRRDVARLECDNDTYSVICPLGFNMILVALCTLYAVKTRNLPENFNEAKFIGFSMYTTCVIWTAFVPLYFGGDFKTLVLCLSMSFSATVILVLLFAPKVYIMLFEPEKNQRSAFATSNELRCHFGVSEQSSNTTKYDQGTSKMGSTKMARVVVKSTSGKQNARKASFVQVLSNDRSCQTSQILLESVGEKTLQSSRDEANAKEPQSWHSVSISSKATKTDLYTPAAAQTPDSDLKKTPDAGPSSSSCSSEQADPRGDKTVQGSCVASKEQPSSENKTFEELLALNKDLTFIWDNFQSSGYL